LPPQVAKTAPSCAACTYETASGQTLWKVYGPDLDGRYGSLQGTGGLEATILDASGTTQGVINDQFGNGVATVSGGTVTWNATRVGAYGPLPGTTASALNDITQLAAATAWRGRRIDPTGFYDLGARYYDPTAGRFLSADPLGQASSPSLYDFAGVDPVNFFDPDGMEQVKVTYRTFIPQKQVTVGGTTYAGDNRGPSTAPSGPDVSSRTTITVTVETDPAVSANPLVSGAQGSAGPSSILDSSGNPVVTKTATADLPNATVTRDGDGNVVIHIEQDTKNPLSPAPDMFTPGIAANLTVTIPPDASTAQASGLSSQYPGEELNVARSDGYTTNIYQFVPPPGATPKDLFRLYQEIDTPVMQIPTRPQANPKCPPAKS
jgi:RHS repeat-associated protein